MKAISKGTMFLTAVAIISMLSCEQARICSCINPDGTVIQTTPLGEVKKGKANELCDELSLSFPGDTVICTVD